MRHLPRIATARNNFALSCQPFEIAAVLGIVRMFIAPAKSSLRQFQRCRIFCCLICSGRPIDAEADSVQMFPVGESRRDFSVVLQPPIRSAVFLVPYTIVE